jgi:hypothetical protein
MQVIVGIIAVIIGAIHIKDYFAYKKGVSLSIPESANPGLYARMRNVVYAESPVLSPAAAATLAVMVNLIELLCTAGLPAAYTQILTLHALPGPHYYMHLVLYNIAYIFDDALMILLAVYTMRRTRLQERAGRVLKLFSGSVILLLGAYLLLFQQLGQV